MRNVRGLQRNCRGNHNRRQVYVDREYIFETYMISIHIVYHIKDLGVEHIFS